MTFHIEITRTEKAGTTILYRKAVKQMSPHRAKIKAASLLNFFARQGANGARVLNSDGEELAKL